MWIIIFYVVLFTVYTYLHIIDADQCNVSYHIYYSQYADITPLSLYVN